ncbi:hypothetical protein SCAR479_05236 [Seiridium cardinale]|uniref:Uncharacterized protein n=1 Tax=Seiridium cardinale TaxID=138064 RepID=A0ABR2XWX5_9PEZI
MVAADGGLGGAQKHSVSLSRDQITRFSAHRVGYGKGQGGIRLWVPELSVRYIKEQMTGI